MSIVLHVALWGLAALGALTIIGIVIAGFDKAKASKTPSVEARRPPVQIVNLREIPRAEPQVPHETAMQITTTKHINPTAAPAKELSA